MTEIKNKTRRVGDIDLLRLVFSVVVMLRHTEYLLGDLDITPFAGGAFAVEFFFLVSGYLMMAAIDRARRADSLSQTTLGRESFEFIKKKFLSFFPEILISGFIGLAFISYAKDYSIGKAFTLLTKTVSEFFLVQQYGFVWGHINNVTWYLSSMLMAMIILYPLTRKYTETMVHVVLPVVILFLLGHLYQNVGSLRGPTVEIGLTFRGNIRAVAEIALGMLLYRPAKKLQSFNMTVFGRICVTVVKWACFVLCLLYMYPNKWDKMDFVYLLVMAAGILLSFSCQGIDAKFFSHKIFTFFGKLSLPVYLCHFYYSNHLKYVLPKDMSRKMSLLIYAGAVFATCLVVMGLAALYRKYKAPLWQGVKRLFVRPDAA